MADPNNIQATEPYRTAVAERGKFWKVDDDYLTTLGYPASGEGKYATLTYQVNSTPVTLSGGDLQIGAVEIKDDSTDTRANVASLSGYNAMATMIVDGDGNQITNFDVSIIGTTLFTTALSGVTSNSIGSTIDVSDYNKLTFHTIATSVISGGNIEIQSSNDGINWVTINESTKHVGSTSNTEHAYSDIKYRYVRAESSGYADGTYTVTLFGGN